jgi:hypothetical protein
MFSLINTNFLIPKIKNFNSFEESMEKLQCETISRTYDWNKKIYVVKKNEQNILFYSDGMCIFKKNLINNENTQIYTYRKNTYMNNDYWILYDDLNKQSDNKNVCDMNLVINEKKKHNVRFEDNDKNSLIVGKIQNKDDLEQKEIIKQNEIVKQNEITKQNEIIKQNEITKRDEIIKMIEEVNELYQRELSNMKKLELNLKTFDTKLKKLEKTKKDTIINEIIRTQSEYRTWKKIKYGLKDDRDDIDVLKPIEELKESQSIVPILFLSKYNYIEKIQNNESIRKILDEINNLDLNNLYSDNALPRDEIVMFCKKYMKLSKELHYRFDDHEWNYLESEMNLNSTNKLGSNVVFSSKI